MFVGEGSFGSSICMVVAGDPTVRFDLLKKSGELITSAGD